MIKKYTEQMSQRFLEKFKNIKIEVDEKEKQKEYSMIITKEVVDRDGDIILVNGIDVNNYLKNPVVLINHSNKVEDIVGKTTSIEKTADSIKAKFIFTNTEKGRLAKELYEGGFLKASSIGFIVKERDPSNYNVITKSELLEWSLVSVPANQNALSLDNKTIKKGIKYGFIKLNKDIDKKENNEINNDLNKKEGKEEGQKIDQKENKEKDNEKEQKGDHKENNLDNRNNINKILLEEIKYLKTEIKEIKKYIKNIADGKAMMLEDDEEKAKLIEQKELLQHINKATSSALHYFKKLNNI